MELLNAAIHWAKAEITSSIFFILFGLVYLVAAIACWKFGNTPLFKALIIPMLIAGGLLLGAGVSFYLGNKSKLSSFEIDYITNPSAFIKSEITSTAQTIKTYENVALKVFPLIILTATFIVIFISIPLVRAICIAIIAFLSVLVLLDSQALKRIKTYHQQLKLSASVS